LTPTRILVAVSVVIAALGAAAIFHASDAGAATHNVEIQDYAYTPASMTVEVGDTVTWTNADSAPHTVTSKGGGPLDSPTLQQGDSWSFTFTTAGTFEYYCALHPDMVGTVTVVDHGTGHAPETTPTTAASTTTVPPATTTSTTTDPPAPSQACEEDDLFVAIFTPFWVHFEKAHLEESPGQQAADILDVNQYVLTHTVLIEHMLQPAVATLDAATEGVEPFWVHFEKAHLERSPSGQAADILDVDQYVVTHTVLIDHMVAPGMEGATGAC
jgi:plastocyanin